MALLAELGQRRITGEPISYAGLALVLQSLGDTDRAVAMLDTAGWQAVMVGCAPRRVRPWFAAVL